jgi:tungstate transport system substrate-binding protein
VLGDTFGKEADAALCWMKAGSGESMQMLKEKKVDMIMVHAPEAEKKAIAEGWAVNRKLIGSNEFFIVGPHRTLRGLQRQRQPRKRIPALRR